MNQELTTNPNGQTDRLISQRQFCKKYGTTPALMNDFENMGVITSMRSTKQGGTIRYIENETWNSITSFIRKSSGTQESTQPLTTTKDQSKRYTLRRRQKDA